MRNNMNTLLIKCISVVYLFSALMLNAQSAGVNTQGEKVEAGQAGTNPTDLTLVVDKENPCVDEEVTFTATTVKLNVSSWKWFINGTEITDYGNVTSSSNNSEYKRMFSEPGSYTCYVTANGKKSNILTVTVHEDFKITVAPKLVCVGDKVIAKVEGCNGNTVEKVKWEYDSAILDPEGSPENQSEVTFLTLGKTNTTTEIKAYINDSTEPISVKVTVTELVKILPQGIIYDFVNKKAKVTLVGGFEPVKHSAEWSTSDGGFFDANHRTTEINGDTVTLYTDLPTNGTKTITVTAKCGDYPVSINIVFRSEVVYFMTIENPLCVDGKIKAVLYKNTAGGASIPVKANWVGTFNFRASFFGDHNGVSSVELQGEKPGIASVTATPTDGGPPVTEAFRVIDKAILTGIDIMCPEDEGKVEAFVCEKGDYKVEVNKDGLLINGKRTITFRANGQHTETMDVKAIETGTYRLTLSDANGTLDSHTITVTAGDLLLGPTPICLNETEDYLAFICGEPETDYRVIATAGLSLTVPATFRTSTNFKAKGLAIGKHTITLEKWQEGDGGSGSPGDGGSGSPGDGGSGSPGDEPVPGSWVQAATLVVEVVDGYILTGKEMACIECEPGAQKPLLWYCVELCDPNLPAPVVFIDAPDDDLVLERVGFNKAEVIPDKIVRDDGTVIYAFWLRGTGAGERTVYVKGGGKESNKLEVEVENLEYISWNITKQEEKVWKDIEHKLAPNQLPQPTTVVIELKDKPEAGGDGGSAEDDEDITWELVITSYNGICVTSSEQVTFDPTKGDFPGVVFNSANNIATLTYVPNTRRIYDVQAKIKCGEEDYIKSHKVRTTSSTGTLGAKNDTPFAPNSKYRNLTIHGQPGTTVRPQQNSETDQPGSKFSIDAYNLSATYSQTDVSIPLRGSDLALEFRRTSSPDTIPVALSLCSLSTHKDPWKQIMGYGWRTNLTAHITEHSKGYVVIDENGGSYEYDLHFRPTKKSFSNHDSFKHTLSEAANGDLIWRKMHGTVYTFKYFKAADSSLGNGSFDRPKEASDCWDLLNQILNRSASPDPHPLKTNSIYQLNKVTDRNSNSIIYEYNGGYFPTKMFYEQEPALFIKFHYSKLTGKLVQVEDPLERMIDFQYDNDQLDKVISPIVNFATEGDPKNLQITRPETSYTYQYLAGFSNSRGKTIICVNSYKDGEENEVKINYQLLRDFEGNTNAHIESIQTPGQIDGTSTYTFIETQNARTVTVTDTRGNVWTYEFTTDTTTITFDSVTENPAEDAYDEFVLDKFYRSITQDGNEFKMSAEFDVGSQGAINLASVTDYWGVICKYEYGTHNVSYKLDGSGKTTSYDFTLYGQPYKEVLDFGGLNLTKQFGYEPTFSQMVSIVDARGFEAGNTEAQFTTMYNIDSRGNRIGEEAPEGKNTAFAYDQFGYQTIATDADGRTTTSSRVYTPTGWTDSSTVLGYDNELSITSSRTSDLVGNVLSTIDGNGNVTTNVYDNMNGLAFTTLASVADYDSGGAEKSPIIMMHRDKNRQVLAKQDARGNWTTMRYDAMLRPVETTVEVSANGAANITSSTSYDDTGNKELVTDARGFQYSFEYDAFNNLIKEIRDINGLALTSTYTYGDNSGNDLFGDTGFVPTEKTDARGLVTKLEYDNAYRLTNTYRGNTGNEVKLSTIVYDAAGNVTGTTTHNDKIVDFATGNYLAAAAGLVSGDQTTLTLYDKLNRPVKTAVDLDGDGASVTDLDDIVTSTFYDLSGNVIIVIDPEGHSAQTEYDGAGRVIKSLVNLDDDAQIQSVGGNAFAILAQANDIVTEKFYDNNSNVLQAVIHNDNGVGDQTISTTYDALNRPVTSTDPELFSSSTKYDLNSNVREVTNARGFKSVTEYDQANRAFRQTLPEIFDAETQANVSPVVVTTFDTNSNVLTSTDARGLVSTNIYDALNRVTETRQIVDANDNTKDIVSLVEYDANNNQTKTTFKRDDVDLISTTVYDSLDRPLMTTDAEGFHSLVLSDLVGNKIKLFDKRANANVDETVNAAPQMRYFTQVTFDLANRMVKNTLPAIAYYERTLAGLSAEINDSPFSEITYLKNNWVTETKDLNGNVSETEYDNAGRKLKVISAIGQEMSYVYDKSSNVLTQTVKNDAASEGDQVTTYLYDKRNLLLSETLNQAVANRERLTSYTYDENGNKKTRTFPNTDGTTYNYDALDRLTSEVYANAIAENRTYNYNNNGAVVLATDETGSTEYQYDILGRQILETKKSQADITNGLSGTIVEAVYDKANNRIRCYFPSDKKTLVSLYDKRNLLTTLKAYHGKVLPAGEAGATAELTTYVYNGNAQQVSCTLPNSQVTTKTFDQADRILSSTTAAQGKDIYSVSYKRDAVGNQLVATESRFQRQDRILSFTYDKVYRLTQEVDASEEKTLSTTYVFDLQGNRITKTVSEVDGVNLTETEHWVYTNDQLNRTTSVTFAADEVASSIYAYGYDVNGNRLTKTITDANTLVTTTDHTYVYDQENRLKSVNDTTGDIFNATYDYRTRRIEKGEGTTQAQNTLKTTKYVYDGGVTCQEFSVDGSSVSLVKQYVRGNGMGGGIGSVLYMERAQDTTGVASTVVDLYDAKGYLQNGDSLIPEYYAYNAVGSVVANTDQQGLTIRENDFDAYGNVTREQDWTSDNFPAEFGGSQNDLLFSTKERDFSTGLDYFGFRYYDAVLGKFTTRDPSGYPDGPNNYLYCGNQPLDRIDPLGLWQEGGHYYTSYIVSRAVGRTHESASKVAFYSQIPDEVHQYEAIHTIEGKSITAKYKNAVLHTAQLRRFNPWAADVQNYLHSLAGMDADKRRIILRKVIQSSSDDTEIGLLLHAFADSYAHSYKKGIYKSVKRSSVSKMKGKIRKKVGEYDMLYPEGVGHGATAATHGRGGSSPDAIGYHHEAYKRYVLDLYRTMGGEGDPMKNEIIKKLLERTSKFNDKHDSGYWFWASYDYKSEIEEMRDYAIKVSGGNLNIKSYKPEANNDTPKVFDTNSKGGDENYDTLNKTKVKKVIDKVKKEESSYYE